MDSFELTSQFIENITTVINPLLLLDHTAMLAGSLPMHVWISVCLFPCSFNLGVLRSGWVHLPLNEHLSLYRLATTNTYIKNLYSAIEIWSLTVFPFNCVCLKYVRVLVCTYARLERTPCKRMVEDSICSHFYITLPPTLVCLPPHISGHICTAAHIRTPEHIYKAPSICFVFSVLI